MNTTNATLLRKNLFQSLESVVKFNERILLIPKKETL